MNQTLFLSLRGRLLPAGALVIVLSLAACDRGNKYEPPPPPSVAVAHPVVRPVTNYLDSTGSASAVTTVDLVARVPGYLEKIGFKDGSIVDKGQLLFVIEPDTYKASLQLAEATLAQQQAQLTRASSEYARQTRLVKQNAGSQANVEKWLAERNSAAAAVSQAKANIEIARVNLGYTKVTAPFTGRIGRHLVDAGNLVGTPSPTKLATIEQIEPIYVYFNVAEPMLLQIRAIARARGIGPSDVGVFPIYVGLQNEKAYPHEGRLDFVDTGIDPSTGTLQIRAVLPNTDRALLPGAFVRVRVPIDRNEQALVVSNRALGVDQTGTYVLLVNADDVVEQRAVETGALVDEMRVITKGLAVTDRVIVDGLQRAIPGIKVAVRENVTAGAPPPAGAAASTPSKPR